ncbi:hypothetical protein ACIPSE_25100 [Streptomyces sp. NPDC090106]|uniref:hypothetical protein n=1 Tax=Streptomyces sp. NPDC090106 TaxID=3365946 RepID=UPI0037F738B2
MREGDGAAREAARREIALLDAWGPRLTGNDAHGRLVGHVARRWTDLGLRVQEDVHTFTRWDAPTAQDGLRLTIGDGPAVLPSSAFPYSGATGPDGVRGPLRLLGGPLPRWSKARDGIAVVELRNRPLPVGRLVRTWDGTEGWGPRSVPLISATLAGAGLARTRKAGVRGVVFVWRDITPDNARDQYVPFTLPYQDLPAVFVAGPEADTVLDAARDGAAATLVLDARLTPRVPTRTVWTVIEGTDLPDETVLVVSHSDGTNSVEENGHIGLVELARALCAAPPRRTVVFVLATGHLRIPAVTDEGQATTRWLRDHPEYWSGPRRAVAGLAIEHLGAVEYRDDPTTGRYGPTGAAEPELLYATTRELKHLVDQEWHGPEPGPIRVSAPGPMVHFGEGEPLYQHGIPAVSLVTAPQYLLSTRQDAYVDVDLLLRQLDGFHRLLRRIDAAPADGLGTVTRPGRVSRTLGTAATLASLLRHRR